MLARLGTEVSGRALAPLRMAVGPLVAIHLGPFLRDATSGSIYRDRFWLPYADWYPHLPEALYVALLWGTLLTAFLVSVGLLTRVAAWATAGGVAYNLFLSQTHFHHNRAFLLILLVAVALLPTGAHLSLDRRLGTPDRLARGRGRMLTLAVVRFEVAAVYTASGVSKLLDPDWFGGLVTRLRVEQHQAQLADRGFPDWAVDVLTSSGFHAVAARVIVLTELAIGLGLLWRRSRLLAVWLAVPFHLAIEATSEVQVFSWAALVALVIWVTPTTTDRRLALPRGAPFIRALDWTGRFRIERGQRLEIVDRDGTVATGRRGLLLLLSRLPATFWPVAPLYALAKRRKDPP